MTHPTVRIRDYHPNPKIREKARVPRSWVNPSTKIAEYFQPIMPHGMEGPLYYEVPLPFAQQLFAGDTFHRFRLQDPEQIQVIVQGTDFTTQVKTIKVSNPDPDDETAAIQKASNVASGSKEKKAEATTEPSPEGGGEWKTSAPPAPSSDPFYEAPSVMGQGTPVPADSPEHLKRGPGRPKTIKA